MRYDFRRLVLSFRLRFLLTVLTLFSYSAAAEKAVLLEGFEYRDAAAAQKEWSPMREEMGQVGVVKHVSERGQSALLMSCDFARIEDRFSWDKRVKWNLSGYSRLVLSVYVDDPTPIGRGTIYLKSGDGWYGFNFTLAEKGWQQITLSLAGAWQEGKTKGWRKIDTIRVSLWKGLAGKAEVAIDDAIAISDEIAVVRGAFDWQKNWEQARGIQRYTAIVTEMLDEKGLNYAMVGAENMRDDSLAGAKIAVLPYHEDISNKNVKILKKFVKRGGKLVLFYGVPNKLASEIGIEELKYQRATDAAEFTAIRINKGALGIKLPDMLQNSHNVLIPKPGPDTRVVGRWVDGAGKGTIPAVTLHENGAYLGHVLNSTDREAKADMLRELMGLLLPELWADFSAAAEVSIGRLGGMANAEQVNGAIAGNLSRNNSSLRTGKSKQLQAKAASLTAQAAAKRQAGDYRQAIKLCRRAKESLGEALRLSFPARGKEFRAIWAHDAIGIRGWDWDKTASLLAANGIDNLIANFLWGGGTSYPSELLPVKQQYADKGDLLKEALAACRKHGIKLHVWKVNWELWWGSPEEWIEKMRATGRLQKSVSGNERQALCPSHPENFKLERDSMLEVARNYDVDGLHFDYIRYPGDNYCFCEGCRERFEKQLGKKLKRWPDDVLEKEGVKGPERDSWQEWRRGNITRLVKAVGQNAKKVRPGIAVSAAVFSDYPYCKETVAQDWVPWTKAGYLDFVCPMDYTEENSDFRQKVTNQLSFVGGAIPLYPGIGSSSPGLTPEQVAYQIDMLRQLGAKGFVIFDLNPNFVERKLPLLRQGVMAE